MNDYQHIRLIVNHKYVMSVGRELLFTPEVENWIWANDLWRYNIRNQKDITYVTFYADPKKVTLFQLKWSS